MLAVLALSLAITTPRDGVRVVYVDRIEVNHFYRWDGSVRLDQLILWRWSNLDRRFYAVAWMTLQGRTTDDVQHRAAWNRMIQRTHQGKPHEPWPRYKGKWVGCRQSPRYDGRKWISRVEKNGEWIEVHADAVVETHTLHDPEAANRAAWPDIERVW